MTSTKELQVPWLPDPIWRNHPVTKGAGHHRIPVGIILAANQKMECITQGKGLSEVQIRLLNDDNKTEGRFVTKSSQPGRASTFSIGYVSVPFVDNEYLKKAPEDKRTITVRYPSNSKILPIYRFGENEQEFFKLWDTQDAEFAYIESDYFGLLIPKIDKEYARRLPGGKHLNDVILFFDGIFTTYNEFVGLSFEETGTNQNVRNRFFLKADKSGAGAAYYGGWCTAESSRSVKSFWLDINHTNWGALHEIGHGYEVKVGDASLGTGEVWNNILAFLYQRLKLGKEYTKKGSQQRNMNRIASLLKGGVEVRSWGLFEKLSFLAHMFDKATSKSFARFNQRQRQEFAGTPYYATGTLLVEKLMHFFAIDFEYDMYPFMKLAKASIGKNHLLEHYYVISHVAYPLSYLISDSKVINTIKEKLNLPFDTSLVTPSDLSSTQLKKNFTVKIDPKIFDVLSGDTLKLMDGSRVVAEQKISSQTISLEDIPVGAYKVFIEPSLKNIKLAYENFYAIVHGTGSSELLLSAEEIKQASLLPDTIVFAGLGDSQFAVLTLDLLKGLLSFRFSSKNPHSYFRNEKYFEIIIKNKKKEILFSKTINGDSTDLTYKEINMNGEELDIEIFHAETKNSNRLKFKEPLMNVIFVRNVKNNFLTATESGFRSQNKSVPKDLLKQNFLKKIEQVAKSIRGKISLYVRPYCQPKYNMLLAVQAYERLFNQNSIDTKVREQYKDCLPPVEK